MFRVFSSNPPYMAPCYGRSVLGLQHLLYSLVTVVLKWEVGLGERMRVSSP